MTLRITGRAASVFGAAAIAGLALAGPAAASEPTVLLGTLGDGTAVSASPPQDGTPTPVPVGSPGDENFNGLLDSTEVPVNPDLPPSHPEGGSHEMPVPVGSPGDSNNNGILDSTEVPDNPDVP
jgi:hypothetical protein